MFKRACLGLLSGFFVVCRPAHALVTSYELHNHPNSGAGLHASGLRMNEIYENGHKDAFTFDFDHAGSDVKLQYSDKGDDSIHIFGKVFGGMDTGGQYVNPKYTGFWNLDFTYGNNVLSSGIGGSGPVKAGATKSSPNNTGSMTALFDFFGDGVVDNPFPLADVDKGGASFHFNNTDHHGLPAGNQALVGWGALMSSTHADHAKTNGEWLFTAKPVPEPASAALLGMGLVALLWRGRKRDA